MRTVVTNLKRYKWIYNNKQVVVIDKTTEQSVVLDKVGFLSLARFILRSLDSMRIDNLKDIKLKFNSVKEKYKDFKKNKKNEIQKTQKTLNKKFEEEMRHSMVDISEIKSGEQM